MDLRRIGDKPLSESIVTWFTDAYMRHSAAKWYTMCLGRIPGLMTGAALDTGNRRDLRDATDWVNNYTLVFFVLLKPCNHGVHFHLAFAESHHLLQKYAFFRAFEIKIDYSFNFDVITNRIQMKCMIFIGHFFPIWYVYQIRCISICIHTYV